MNIHIQDKELVQSLFNSTILQIEFGSVLYGTDDENSDKDIMCIFIPNENMKSSEIYRDSVHQFQYKDIENNIDYIFTDIYSFFQNIVNGDSSINFEILHTKAFEDNEYLNIFFEIRDLFYTYKVVKGYTGKVKKDIKNIYKYGKDKRGFNKKLIHAFRGFIYARSIFENILDETEENFKLMLDDSELGMISMFKELDEYDKRNACADSISKKNLELRKLVNTSLDNGKIKFKLLNSEQLDLNRMIETTIKLAKHRMINTDKLIDLVLDANDNGIEY